MLAQVIACFLDLLPTQLGGDNRKCSNMSTANSDLLQETGALLDTKLEPITTDLSAVKEQLVEAQITLEALVARQHNSLVSRCDPLEAPPRQDGLKPSPDQVPVCQYHAVNGGWQ